MTRPIDEKIVAMKMDNSDFKRKAVETTGLFGKLRDSLNKIPGVNLGKVTNDLSGIQKAANRTDMGNLASSVDSIANRFSALNVMATTALVNITNKAVNAGTALARSFGMDQVRAGFSEYELKMGSIGTVLSNTEWNGTGLSDVNKTLAELNEYADQTIYNFAQMTQNIGRFTAAGVTLEDSATAIKGLGNLAAISGSNTDQLNTAMYQMSQALSSGKLNLMDWNSLINAGMGGKKTQDALLATAKAMGVNVDMSEGFRNSIGKGWLSSEIFLETLKQFGKDESMTEAATKVKTFTQMIDTLKEGIGSGWATTWELIFGDFEEATRLWTGLSDFFGGFFEKQADARNNMLRKIIDGDGLPSLISGIKNTITPLIQIFGAIGEGFSKAFPPMGVSKIESLFEAFKKLTSSFKLSSSSVKNLEIIFAGFFSVFAIGLKIIKGIGVIILNLIPSFEGLGSKILELIAMVAKIPIAFNKSSDSGESLGSAMDVLKTVAGGVAKVLESVVGGIIVMVSGFKTAVGYVDSLNLSLSPVSKTFENFFNTLGKGFTWLKDKAVGIKDAIRDIMPSGNELFAGGFVAGLIAIVGIVIKVTYDLFQVFTGWGKIGQGVKEVLEGVGDTLNAFSMQVKAQALLTIAIAIGVLAGSLFILQGLDSSQIVNGLYAIVGSMTALVTAMAIISKYDITGGGVSTVLTIVGLAIGFSIMAGALSKIKDLNWQELSKGLVGVVVVLGALSGALALMGKFAGAGVGVSALQLVALAGTVYILMISLEKISKMDLNEIGRGMFALGQILLLLTGAVVIMGKFGGKVGASALQFVALAGSILMLTSAIEKLSEMDQEKLNQGLKTVALILGAIALFTVVTSDKGLLATGVGLVLLAAAMTALMIPIAALGNMDVKKLAIGLGAMAVALVAIGLASLMMTGMVAAGAGLILVAVALNMLIVPIAALGNMKWETLALGIGGLALAILAIGGAAIVIGLGAPALLLGAAGIAAIGLAMLAAGAGMSLFSAGLVALATMTAASITAIVAVLATLIAGLASLIPTAIDFVVDMIVQMVDAISTHAPKIYSKLTNMVLDLIDVLTTFLPQFIEKGTNFILKLQEGMGIAIPAIVESSVQLMIKLVNGMTDAIRNNGPLLVDAFMELMGEIVILIIDAGVATITALFGWIPGVKDAMTVVGLLAEATVRSNFGAKEVAEDKGDEFSTGLTSKKGQVKSAAEGLATVGKDGAASVKMTTTGEQFGQGFITGIASKEGGVMSAATGLAAKAAGALAKFLQVRSPSRVTMETGGHAGQGFANGLSSKKKETEKSANSIAGVLMNALGIKAPVQKESSKGGEQAVDNFSKGADSKSHKAHKSGKKAGDNFSKGISSTKKTAEQKAKEVADAANNAYREAVATADYKLDMDWINDAQYLEQIKKIARQYSKYPDIVRETNVKIKRLEEEAVKDKKDASRQKYENEKKAINDRKYFNTISLDDEYKFWKSIQSRYKAGTEERMEADREVYRLKNEMIASQFAKDKKVIDDRKYYNDISLSEELKAWQNIQRRYQKGSDQRIEADREVYRLKNELNNKLIAINEDYTSKIKKANEDLIDGERKLKDDYLKSVQETNQKLIDEERKLTDAYDSALKDRTKSLTNFAGLFDQVQNKRVSGRTLIRNLEGQLKTFSGWTDNIKELSKKGIDEELLAGLKEMGPKAAGEVAALNTLTEEQLIQYSGLWKSKNELARNEAIDQLQTLKAETHSKIEELRYQTRIQLDSYKTDWANKVDELRAQTTAQLETYKTEWLAKITEISTGTKDEFVKLETSMTKIGSDAIKGMMTGMGNMEGPLMAQAKSIADSISKTIKSALKIKSPSRVLMGLGEYAGEGLAIGLSNSVDSVSNSAKTLAMTAKDSLNKFLDGFETDIDNELHFKAIIDYDDLNLNKFGKSIAMIPDTSLTSNLVSSTKSDLRQNDDIYRRSDSNEKDAKGNSTVINQSLTFHSKQLTPSEVARKNLQASRQLAMQWGV